MEAVLVGVTGVVLKEGVKFLYAQAGEVLRAWRKRKQDPKSPPPTVLKPPDEVSVGRPDPLPNPVNDEMLDSLQELKDAAEAVKDGAVDADSSEARAVIANLRELLEASLRAPITLKGEAPRSVDIRDIEVTVKTVEGRVRAVTARLDKLRGNIEHVRVRADDVKKGGDVSGVELK